METENDLKFEKIAVLDGMIETQLVSSVLDERRIPYLVRSYHDTAYDGLYQAQKGWAELRAPYSHQAEILEILESLRSENMKTDDFRFEEVENGNSKNRSANFRR